MPGFVRLYDTYDETEMIHRYKNDKLQDGIYREILPNGDSSYGTQIFAKSHDGEETSLFHLYKNTGGNIDYLEQILVFGQDETWRTLTHYRFNPKNLGWEELDL